MAPKSLTIRRHSPTTIHYSITNRPLPQTAPGYVTLFLADILRLVASIWSVLIAFIVIREHWREWQTSGLPPHISSPNTITELQQDASSKASTSPIRLLQNQMGHSGLTLASLTSTLQLPLQLLPSSIHSGFLELHTGIPTPNQETPSPIPLTAPLVILLSTSLLLYLSHTTTESLLVIHTLGVQISRSTTYLPFLSYLSARISQSLALETGFPASVLRGLRSLTTLSGDTRFIPTSQIQDVLIHEAFIGWEVRFYLAVVVRGEEGLVVVFERLLPRLDVVETVWRGAREVLWEEKEDDQSIAHRHDGLHGTNEADDNDKGGGEGVGRVEIPNGTRADKGRHKAKPKHAGKSSRRAR